MNQLLFAAALAAATSTALAHDNQGTDSIGQPDYYGLLDMVNYQLPQTIYRNPLAIEQVPTNRAPVYLRVPPGHAKNWRKHCGAYHACDERALFVQDDWYNREYVPRYQKHHKDRGDYYGNKHSNDDHGNKNHDRNGVNGNNHHWWSQNKYRGNQDGYYNRGRQNDYRGKQNGDEHQRNQNNDRGDNHNDGRDH